MGLKAPKVLPEWAGTIEFEPDQTVELKGVVVAGNYEALHALGALPIDRGPLPFASIKEARAAGALREAKPSTETTVVDMLLAKPPKGWRVADFKLDEYAVANNLRPASHLEVCSLSMCLVRLPQFPVQICAGDSKLVPIGPAIGLRTLLAYYYQGRINLLEGIWQDHVIVGRRGFDGIMPKPLWLAFVKI